MNVLDAVWLTIAFTIAFGVVLLIISASMEREK